MEKVTINGKEYSIDIEKCKEQGLLVEEKSYPKDWTDLSIFDRRCRNWYDVGVMGRNSKGIINENLAFIALGKLIQLRDWWWDNMCDGWRPDGEKYTCMIYRTIDSYGKIAIETGNSYGNSYTLSFPSGKIRNKFLETYRDLINEAKMFL